MTGRDRIVVIGIVALLVLGGAWLLVVSPERKQAAELNTQVGTGSAQLATANSEVASASSAQTQYAAVYASIVSLGKAVPPTQEVSSLIYQIAQASHQKHVEFASIVSGGGPGSSSSASAPAAPAAAAAGFTAMPFTFTFNGSFLALYHLFQQLDRYTVLSASGGLQVSGRLLTIQSVKLTPLPVAAATQTSSKGGSEQLSGVITATAYVLPATQGLTAGATTSAPAGVASPTSTATPTSSSGASSSPTAPAIARVTP
jgi:hypothetical protein